MALWSGADRVRAELAAGGARRLGDALVLVLPAHQAVWLELEPAHRREILAASPELRRDAHNGSRRWADAQPGEALVVFDDLIAFGDLPAQAYGAALRVLLDAAAEQPMAPERARAYLAAGLPHAAEDPRIRSRAARVLVELGDRDGALDQLALARRHGGDLVAVRNERAFGPLRDDPRWAELFAGPDPVAHTDLELALTEPLQVRELILDRRTVLPRVIGRMVNLEVLRIRRCRMRVLPDWLASLPRLHTITLRHCTGLTEIADEILAMPSLREFTVDHPTGRFAAYEPRRLAALLAGFAGTGTGAGTDRRTRLLHVALLTGGDDRTTGYAPAELVAALTSNVAAVRSAALRLLGVRLDPSAIRLRPGDRVLLAGTLDAGRDVLAGRLAGIGVTLGSRRADLVVVGDRPGATAVRLAAAGVPVILEPHLRSMLDAHATPYLVAAGSPTGDEAGDDLVARLRELLVSPDGGNVRLAVEMMRTGGVPDGVLEELMLVALRTGTDAKVRAEARKLFAQYAPRAARDAVRTVLAGRSLYSGGETRLSGRLRDLATFSAGMVDPVRLATLMLPDRGVKYLLDVGHRDPAVAARVLGTLCTAGTLDLSGRELVRVPPEIAGLAGLTRIDLSDNRLTGFPERLCDVATLESLDLSRNGVTAIPDGIARLTSLRRLALAGLELDAFPVAVTRLPTLRRLDLSIGSTAYAHKRFRGLPDAIGDLTGLEELALAGHALATLPEALRGLTRLRRLDLGHGTLGSLPDWLAELPALRELDLTYCRIPETPGLDDLIRRLHGRGVTIDRR